MLDLEPEKRLRITWRCGHLDTTVTWTLAAEGHSTRLFLEHPGFDRDDTIQQQTLTMLGGWRSHVVASLEHLLATYR